MARRLPRKTHQEELEKRPLKKKIFIEKGILDAIDEAPEFHDPYSELNLFLSQKIKREMCHCSNSKKWSLQLQDELVHKITPEFQKRFPKYRLGVSALKKTWEKVQYFSTQIQGRKEALSQDGKLNLSFFIKENLKSTRKLQNTCHLHPCHYAHQLAVKMGECVAVVDGIRPKLDQLTRTIWLLQRHLIPNLAPEHFKSPYDENEKIDKLIVKSILEITAKHPEISQAELAFHVQKRLIQIRAIGTTYTLLQIEKILMALFADLHSSPTQKMERILERIPYPIAKCLKSELALTLIDAPHLTTSEAIEKTVNFFQKAIHAFDSLEEEEIERKIQNWVIQGEMLLRWIRLNHQSALFIEVERGYREFSNENLFDLVSQIHQNFLKKYPDLVSSAKDIEIHIWIYLKYLWYKKMEEDFSTYDRFIQWHQKILEPKNLSPLEQIEKIEKICKKMLPLIPFSRTHTQSLLFSEKKECPQNY